MAGAGYGLGVGFGTSNPVAVLRWPDGRARPLLVDGSPLLPSSVYADPNGTILVGRDAIHSARLDPARFEPNPKRRVDDQSVLLGDRELTVVDVVAAVLNRVAEEARRTTGGAPLHPGTLTCPAGWGPTRRRVLIAAAAKAGWPNVRLVEEPGAAATYFPHVLGRAVEPGAGRGPLERVRVPGGARRGAKLAEGRRAGVFLVGGAGGILLGATLLHQTLGEPPLAIEQPEMVVAEGSLFATSTAGTNRAN